MRLQNGNGAIIETEYLQLETSGHWHAHILGEPNTCCSREVGAFPLKKLGDIPYNGQECSHCKMVTDMIRSFTVIVE